MFFSETRCISHMCTYDSMCVVGMRDYSVSFKCKQVSFDSTPPKCILPPLQHSHIRTHITLTFDL